MEDCLSTTLEWMPEVENYCWGRKLYQGAKDAVLFYLFLSFICVLKPIILVDYHHDGNTFIMYIQCIFVYIAAIVGFFAFYLNLPFCWFLKSGDFPLNTLSLLFVLLCLIMGTADVIWGILTFIRSFVDPGLCPLDNGSSNPFDRRRRRRGRGIRYTFKTEDQKKRDRERKNKSLQWKKEHENDTIIRTPSTTCDAIVSLVYTLIEIYAFYPLICFKSYLGEGPDDD